MVISVQMISLMIPAKHMAMSVQIVSAKHTAMSVQIISAKHMAMSVQWFLQSIRLCLCK